MKYSVLPKGFTLIEIIVVMSVIGILSTIGIAAFADYSRAQAVRIAAEDLSTMLNTARSRAQSQVKPNSGMCSSSSLSNYQVVITANSYELNAICTAGLVNVQTRNSPSGISFSVATFTFPLATGTIVFTTPPDPETISVSDNYGNTKSIDVYTDGRIVLQ